MTAASRRFFAEESRGQQNFTRHDGHARCRTHRRPPGRMVREVRLENVSPFVINMRIAIGAILQKGREAACSSPTLRKATVDAHVPP